MIADALLFAPPAGAAAGTGLAGRGRRGTPSPALAGTGRRRRGAASRRTSPPVALDADPDQLAVVVAGLGRNAIEAGATRLRYRGRFRGRGTRSSTSATTAPASRGGTARTPSTPSIPAGRRGGGLGFGLPKCWRIVTLHGGSVRGAEPAGRDGLPRRPAGAARRPTSRLTAPPACRCPPPAPARWAAPALLFCLLCAPARGQDEPAGGAASRRRRTGGGRGGTCPGRTSCPRRTPATTCGGSVSSRRWWRSSWRSCSARVVTALVLGLFGGGGGARLRTGHRPGGGGRTGVRVDGAAGRLHLHAGRVRRAAGGGRVPRPDRPVHPAAGGDGGGDEPQRGDEGARRGGRRRGRRPAPGRRGPCGGSGSWCSSTTTRTRCCWAGRPGR